MNHKSVYITESNFQKLIPKDNINISSITDYMLHSMLPIFEQIQPMFNRLDLCFFYIYGDICKKQDLEAALEKYTEPKKHFYNESKAFDDSNPAYHQNHDCAFLHKNYFNIEMPSKVKNKGKDEIKRFKEFVSNSAMKTMARDNITKFSIKVSAHFPYLDTKDISSNVLNYENSKSAPVSDKKLDNILSLLKIELDKMEALRCKSIENEKLVNNYIYSKNLKKDIKNHESRDDKHLIPTMKLMEKIKSEMKKLIFSHLSNSSEKKIDETILIKFGFKQCKACDVK